jgi:hypothetical protein
MRRVFIATPKVLAPASSAVGPHPSAGSEEERSFRLPTRRSCGGSDPVQRERCRRASFLPPSRSSRPRVALIGRGSQVPRRSALVGRIAPGSAQARSRLAAGEQALAAQRLRDDGAAWHKWTRGYALTDAVDLVAVGQQLVGEPKVEPAHHLGRSVGHSLGQWLESRASCLVAEIRATARRALPARSRRHGSPPARRRRPPCAGAPRRSPLASRRSCARRGRAAPARARGRAP